MDEFLGTIKIFGFSFAPRGWAFCQGQLLSIAANTALFSLLGTTYGGDGVTTFGLPDLRGRVAVGQGQGPGLSFVALGEVAGAENTTIVTTQLPPHTHTATVTVTATLHAEAINGTAQNPNGKMLASGNPIYVDPDPGNDRAMAPQSIVSSGTAVIGPTGGGQPVPILQPFLGVNYCIATQGIFPPRN